MSLVLSLLVGGLASYALAALLRRLLHEGRVWVVAPPALGLGFASVSLALLWFGRLVAYVAILAVLAGLIVLTWAAVSRLRRRDSVPDWTWGMGARATVGYLALALFAGTGALALWSASVWGGVTHENLFQHTGLATMLTRQPPELRHPLEPDDPLTYRLAYHYLTAGAARASGLAVSSAIQLVTLAAAVLAVLSMFAAIGRRHSLGAAFLGSILFLAGGPLSFVAGRLPPPGAGSALDRLLTTLERLPAGATHPGPLGQLTLINGSLVFGYAIAAVALALYVETWAARGRRALVLGALGGLTLGALAAAAESLFAVLATALLLDLARRTLLARGAYRTVFGPAIAFVIPLGLTLITAAGVLATDAAAGATRSRLGLAFSGALTGSAPTAALANLSQDTIANRLAAGDGWLAMWSLDFMLDVGFTPLLALAALVWLAYRRRSLGSLLALASLISFAVTALVTVRTYPWDTFRFTQSGMTFGYVAAGLAAVEALQALAPRARRPAWGAVLAIALLACGAYLSSAAAWPDLVARREGADYALDIELSQRLVAATEAPPRLLVAPGATDWFGLHSNGDNAITKYVVAYGSQVPMGHDWYGNYQAYLPTYRQAYDTFDLGALGRLKLTYLYLLPNRLDPPQREGLERLLRSGQARLFASAGAGSTLREVYQLLITERRP